MNTALCVFCGEKPDEKTKEHIIPKWLIERTGNKKRAAFFGLRWGKMKDGMSPDVHTHAFDQYTFPACKRCNDRFSELEDHAASIFGRLSDGIQVDAQEIPMLLDWFDKVRVGLWLGGRTLGTNIFRPKLPKFSIDKRIGQSDRFLYISRMHKEVGEGLTWIGVGTPIFGSMPSVFGLRANNLMFLNGSSGSFLARRLGLPYAEDVRIETAEGVFYEGQIKVGTGRTVRPLLPYFYPIRALQIYQPLYPYPLVPEVAEYFRGPLVENYLCNIDYLIGRVLTMKDGKIEPVDNLTEAEYGDMEVLLRPEIPDVFMRAVLEVQNVLGTRPFWGGRVTVEQQQRRNRQMADLRRLNSILLRKM